MLEQALKKTVEEISNLLSYGICLDELSRLIYSSDASMIKAKPAGVIHIKDINEISAVVKILHKNGIPFTARGAGTNLSGGATNSKGGFIINLAPCSKIHQIDTENEIAVVEPGVVNMDLQNELKKFDFFYPPDPASQKVSTIGGNIAENAGGPRCIKYGVTLNNVYAVEVVLPDGSECFFSVDDYGPELINLFIGSEGTLGIIKKAYLKILPLPKFSAAIYAEFKTLEDAMKCVEDIISAGIIPSAVEGLDRMTAELVLNKDMDKNIEGILIIEVDSHDKNDLLKQKDEVENIVKKNAVLVKFSDSKEEIEELFRIRKDAYPSLAKIANNIIVEDGCVPRSMLSQAVKEIKKIISDSAIKATLVFHAGDGNIHPNLTFDERNIKDANKIRKIAASILEVYLKYNGSVSAEHGIGVEKRGYVALQHDKSVIEILRGIKSSIDEKNLSNPYKKIPLTTEIPKKVKRKLSSEPEDIREIKNEIEKRYKEKKASVIRGNLTYLKDTHGLEELSSKGLKRILDFDKKNMILIAESGISIAALNEFLRDEGFMTIPSQQTLGGFVSQGLWKEIRDLIISLDVILSDGRILHLGSKNIKDTSIYEIMRVFIGSRGTLGFITSVAIKIFKGKGSIKLTEKKLIKNITPIHLKIKKVFDPENLFNPFMMEDMYLKNETHQ